jgi:hypothetical protein
VARFGLRPVRDRELFDFVRPSSARCLFTVRAAISLARFALRPPRFFELSLMCSYCLSSLSDQAWGAIVPSDH